MKRNPFDPPYVRSDKTTTHMTLNVSSPRNEASGIDEKPRVLYIDDDQANLDSFKANFRDQFTVFTSNTPVQAYNMVADEGIQIVIADHNMPSMSGVEFLESISNDFPSVQRILLTGYSELVPVVEAVNKGKVFRILTKPFNMKEISKMVVEAWSQFKESLEQEQLIHQLKRQNAQFEFILRQRLLS
jgi:DNA-binding NtrC family response regulator